LPASRLLGYKTDGVKKPSLSSVQAIVAITAGVLSVLGGAYSFWQHIKPVAATGQVVAILREGRSDRPVTGATVEVLTERDELVATLTSPDSGRLQHTLKEGSYRLRVSHPRYAAEYLAIHVTSGQMAEVRVELMRSAAGSTPIGDVVDEGVGAVRRFFRDLGGSK
jgi:hypothetical protein